MNCNPHTAQHRLKQTHIRKNKLTIILKCGPWTQASHLTLWVCSKSLYESSRGQSIAKEVQLSLKYSDLVAATT